MSQILGVPYCTIFTAVDSQHADSYITVNYSNTFHNARGGAVGSGTALQAGRSWVWFLMVSMEFFIDIILPAALCPWGWLSLQQKWVPGIFTGGGVKAAGAQGWQPYHLHVPNVLKSGSLILLEPSGPVQACHGIALPFTFHNTKEMVTELC